MKHLPLLACLASLTLPTIAAAQTAETPAKPAAPQTFESEIKNNKGESIGTIKIRDGSNSLVMRLAIKAGGLPPGWHGIHFHAVGDCSDTEKFEKSKAHVNHDQSKHGLLNPDGPDEGDLPNVYANADGSALVIHANEDDHASQPIGGAGPRIACSVIK